jgi:predicted lipoprotein with Yx(FWY)xxD motif
VTDTWPLLRSEGLTGSRYYEGDSAMRMRNPWWVGLGLAAAAALLAACGSNGKPAASATSHPAASSAAPGNAAATADAIKTMSTSKGTVLANASGLTLYWFAKDTSTQSNCAGSCLTYWPPVMGKAIAAPGTSLPHGFGTITLANGQTQVTYDGHPLYTYKGDTAAGQIAGNGLNASGGLWWAITPSGAELSASSSSSSSGSGSSTGGGGGGYGY